MKNHKEPMKLCVLGLINFRELVRPSSLTWLATDFFCNCIQYFLSDPLFSFLSSVNNQTTDDIFNLAPGSSHASFLGNVDFGSYSQGFCTTDIGVDLSFAGGLVPKPIYDENSSFISDIQLKNSLSVAGHNVALDQKEGKFMISSSTGSSGCSGSSTACLDDENMSDDRPVKRKRFSSCDSKTNSEHNGSKIVPFNEGNRGDKPVTEKRLRKPPRRYSEESIEQKSRSNIKKSAPKASKDKSLPLESHKQQWQKKLKAAPVVHKDKSFNGGCIQVPFGLPIEEGHSAKKRTCWVRAVSFREFIFFFTERIWLYFASCWLYILFNSLSS